MFLLCLLVCTEQNTLSSFFPQKVQYSNVKNTVIFKKGPSKRGFSMAVSTFKTQKEQYFVGRSGRFSMVFEGFLMGLRV